jgi:hypothetical protein
MKKLFVYIDNPTDLPTSKENVDYCISVANNAIKMSELECDLTIVDKHTISLLVSDSCKIENLYSYVKDCIDTANGIIASTDLDDIFTIKFDENKAIVKRIREFLKKYAALTPDGEYNGPDSNMLEFAADQLEVNGPISRLWSDWGSGCYKPYSSKEGRLEHDEIVNLIYSKMK